MHALAAAFASLVIGLLRLPSRQGRRRLAFAVATLVYGLGIRRRVALENLRLAFPEKSEAERRRIALGAYRTMAFSMIEGLASEAYGEAEIARTVDATAWERVEASLPSGQGAVVATAHFGSWEVLGEVMARRGVAINVVTKPLRGAFNERIVAARAAAGLKLLSPHGALRACNEAIRRSEVVVLLVDQSIGAKHGVFVPFFGQPASTNPAFSLVAKRTGAPAYVAMAHWEGTQLVVAMEGPFPVPDTGDPEADVAAHTATITACVERHIRLHPEQWLWLHRRWKEKPLTRSGSRRTA